MTMRIAALVLIGLGLAGCAEAPAAPAYAWALPAGHSPPPVPDDNPMSAAKVELGRHLFHDPRLSGTGAQACASCHVQAHAFAEPRATSVGSTGATGRRNAPGLVDVGYRPSLTWADHTATLLEPQARVPMFGAAPVELGLPDEGTLEARLAAEPTYAALFAEAFPDEPTPLTVHNVTRALACFQRTILGGRSRFDRFVAGDTTALSAAEQRGFARFTSPQLGCASCHAGPDFTTPGAQFFNTGLYDLDGAGAYPTTDTGLAEVTGDPTHVGRFRVPSLRNVAVTAPYMHDGSVATLGEVLDIYARGGRLITDGPLAGDGATSPRKSPLVHAFALTAEDRADLVAFLGALTDEAVLADPALADPWR